MVPTHSCAISVVCTSLVSSFQNLLKIWGDGVVFFGSRCCRDVFNWLPPFVHLPAESLAVVVMMRSSPLILLVLGFHTIFSTWLIFGLHTGSTCCSRLYFLVRLHHAGGRCAQELGRIARYDGELVIIIVSSSTEKLDATAQIQVSQGPSHKVTIAVDIKVKTGRVHNVLRARVLHLVDSRTATAGKVFAEARRWSGKWIVNMLIKNDGTQLCKIHCFYLKVQVVTCSPEKWPQSWCCGDWRHTSRCPWQHSRILQPSLLQHCLYLGLNRVETISQTCLSFIDAGLQMQYSQQKLWLYC